MFGFGFRKNSTLPVATLFEPEEPEFPELSCTTDTLDTDAFQESEPLDVFSSEDIVLVSKEDIYTREGQQVVLLLKQGREITVDDLPRFLNHGITPSQFWLKKVDRPAAQEVSAYGTPPQGVLGKASRPAMTPIGSTTRAVRKHQSVLILDSDAKSLRRTTDCLFRCGFSLGRIHPVRLPSHLGWTLQKYRPDVLVVDYHLEGGYSPLELIQAVSELPAPPEHVFLTLTLSEAASNEEQEMIHTVAERLGIRVLLKPLNRFAVHSVLEQQGT